MPEGTERTGTCAGCGAVVVADGVNAGPLAGRLLCRDCTDAPVVFEAECLDCEWTHRVDGREAERYAGRQRVQQEANSHEREQRVFNDERHEAVWREVEA